MTSRIHCSPHHDGGGGNRALTSAAETGRDRGDDAHGTTSSLPTSHLSFRSSTRGSLHAVRRGAARRGEARRGEAERRQRGGVFLSFSARITPIARSACSAVASRCCTVTRRPSRRSSLLRLSRNKATHIYAHLLRKGRRVACRDESRATWCNGDRSKLGRTSVWWKSFAMCALCKAFFENMVAARILDFSWRDVPSVWVRISYHFSLRCIFSWYFEFYWYCEMRSYVCQSRISLKVSGSANSIVTYVVRIFMSVSDITHWKLRSAN